MILIIIILINSTTASVSMSRSPFPSFPPNLLLSTSGSVHPPPMIVMPSLDESLEEKDEIEEKPHKEEAQITKYFNLKEIVELVTCPHSRGTQNQIVLILTYCLYSSRELSWLTNKYSFFFIEWI